MTRDRGCGPVRRANAPERRLFRDIGLALAEVDTTDAMTYLEGRAVPYDVRADTGWLYHEEFAPGVFAESIAAHPYMPLLLWHNGRSFPVGAAEEWIEQPDGLHGVWRLDGHADAQRAARQARDGFLTGMSVGFAPEESKWTYGDWEDWDPDEPATWDSVRRTRARLLEVSLTPTPVYADAQVALVRSAEGRRNRARTGQVAASRRRTSEPPPATVDTPATPRLDKWRRIRATL